MNNLLLWDLTIVNCLNNYSSVNPVFLETCLLFASELSPGRKYNLILRCANNHGVLEPSSTRIQLLNDARK